MASCNAFIYAIDFITGFIAHTQRLQLKVQEDNRLCH